VDIETLKLFIMAAPRVSFVEAALELDLDPLSISRLIAGLERKLGMRLFPAHHAALNLTEAGEVYLQRIEPLMDELERARIEALNISTAPAGTLRLTTSVTFGQTVILPLLPAFRQRFPRLMLDAVFADANIDLVAERIDLAMA
jgi:DNA-binding transcriptional LysR family regulator